MHEVRLAMCVYFRVYQYLTYKSCTYAIYNSNFSQECLTYSQLTRGLFSEAIFHYSYSMYSQAYNIPSYSEEMVKD